MRHPDNRGFILIATTLITALILLLAGYLLNFTLTELRISTSQAAATQAYYLAESGVAEAIWKITNDPTWKSSFESNPNWTVHYSRNSAMHPGWSYDIDITNSGNAKGRIVVTGKVARGASVAQRVIETSVFKAMGENPLGDVAEYADGNIEITASVIRVHQGGLHSNNNIQLKGWSTANVDGAASAGNNIILSTYSNIISATRTEHAIRLDMPAVSFDSAGDPDSYKSRANQIYTESQFSNLLKNNETVTLNGITYVTGDIDVQGGRNLIVNGALVADGDITLGKNTLACCWQWRCGRSNITVNRPSTSTPAGILAKGKIEMELCMSDLNVTGLIYANDKLDIVSIPSDFKVTGALLSRKLDLASIWQGIDVYHDENAVIYGLGNPQYAPIVTVEHWEEEY